VGRKQLVAVILLLVVVAVAAAVAFAATSHGDGKQPRPARPAVARGVGDDNADVMRALERDKLARSHK
jgi:flagellar basal body-associated protein FliL